MTQPQFSRVTGIPFSTLRFWITAENPMLSGLSIAKLSKALGTKRCVLQEKIRMATPEDVIDRKRAS